MVYSLRNEVCYVALLSETLRVVHQLATGDMSATDLAAWLATRLPDLWDAGSEDERWVLSELSLALEESGRNKSAPQLLTERAIVLAKEIEEQRMASSIERQEILGYIGDPARVDRELQQFRRAARVLSSRHPRLIDLYNRKWVAVYRGKVQVQARSLPSLMAQISEKGLPRGHVIVRFIDKNQRTMIL